MTSLEDLTALRDHAFRWVDQAYGEANERAGRGLAKGYDPGMAAEIAGQGWLAVMVSAQNGGMGGGLREMAAVMEAVGRGLVAEPVLSQGAIAAPLLDRLGTPQARQRLSPVLDGASVAVMIHQEADAGFERTITSSRLSEEDGRFHVDASKAPVLDAAGADILLVTALDAAGRTAVVAVEADAPGVRLVRSRSVDGRMLAAVELDRVAVPADAILSAGADASAIVEAVLEEATLLVCAEACGAMPVLVDATADYLRTRSQFGRPLASFQVLQHRMVDMLLAAEEASAVVEAALDAADGPERKRAFALAKIVTARSARFVAQQAVQLHGGIGMTDDLKVSRHFRRLMQCETMFGDADWHAERFDGLRV